MASPRQLRRKHLEREGLSADTVCIRMNEVKAMFSISKKNQGYDIPIKLPEMTEQAYNCEIQQLLKSEGITTTKFFAILASESNCPHFSEKGPATGGGVGAVGRRQPKSVLHLWCKDGFRQRALYRICERIEFRFLFRRLQFLVYRLRDVLVDRT